MNNRKLYYRWHHILERCYNPKRKDYRYYGGKGIGVCNEWHSFANFKEWFIFQLLWRLRNDSADDLVVDRIDPGKSYGPDNCRLITASENSRRAIYRRDSRGRFAKCE